MTEDQFVTHIEGARLALLAIGAGLDGVRVAPSRLPDALTSLPVCYAYWRPVKPERVSGQMSTAIVSFTLEVHYSRGDTGRNFETAAEACARAVYRLCDAGNPPDPANQLGGHATIQGGSIKGAVAEFTVAGVSTFGFRVDLDAKVGP